MQMIRIVVMILFLPLTIAVCVNAQRSVGAPEELATVPLAVSSAVVDTPSSSARAHAVWAQKGVEIVGIAKNAAYYWDSDVTNSGQIVSLSLANGQRLNSREISGLNINGRPRYWLAGPGGFLASWGEPMLIGEENGDLAVRWKARPGRWSDAMLVGEHLIVWQYRPASAVVALSPVDGSEIWSSPLERDANSVELRTDGERVYVVWQQYSATAPTPTITIPQRVRAFDLATGRNLWTQDFNEHTGGIAVAHDTLVVAKGSDLHFLDGQTRREIMVVPTGHSPNIYPSFAVDGTTVYVGLWDAVTAYEVTTGRMLWTHPILLDGGPELAIADELLLITTDHMSLAAIDRQSGERRWELLTGVSANRLFVNEYGVALIGGDSAGVPFPVKLQRERAIIHGQVVAKCRELTDVQLVVGPQRLNPAGDGTFSTTVDMAGELLVSAPGSYELSPNYPHQAIVKLIGRGEYRVPTLTLDFCDRPLESLVESE